MPVSSGKTKLCDAYRKMVKARQFFAIGDIFRYSPVVSPDSEVIVEVRPCTDVVTGGFGVSECNQYCALSKYCADRGNIVTVNGDDVNYIPECQKVWRKDNESVYFKEFTL